MGGVSSERVRGRLGRWRARFLFLHNLIREMAAVRNSLTDRLRASSPSPPPLILVFLLWEGKWIHTHTQPHIHTHQLDFLKPSSVDVFKGYERCEKPQGIIKKSWSAVQLPQLQEFHFIKSSDGLLLFSLRTSRWWHLKYNVFTLQTTIQARSKIRSTSS